MANLINRAIEKTLCEHSLYDLVKIGWKHVDPAEFVDDWHIKVICDELEALHRGEMLRLIINIPPRCLKSTICCVFFPVWVWLQDQTQKILTGSYSQTLATRDTVKSRNLIRSNWFQELWGDTFHLSVDQNQKTLYSNNKKGERISFSVGGTLTGSGGDIIMIDDPISAMDAESKVVRESVNNWFKETVTTRLNNPRTGKILVIMQRLHQNDLTGFLLGQENNEWKNIILPMRYEGEKKHFDIRTFEGEILTQRYTEASLKLLESALGSYGTASQLQQKPAPREGGMIKHQWIKYYKELPTVIRWSWSWDTAIKDGDKNDPSVGLLWAECENGYYLVDMFRGKIEWPELERQVKICFQKQPSSEILVEDKASGQQILQAYQRIGTMPFIAMMPGKNMPLSKVQRLSIVSPLFEAGKVFLPEAKPWVGDVVDELTNFPNALHDDIVDSSTQYLNRRLNDRDGLWWAI